MRRLNQFKCPRRALLLRENTYRVVSGNGEVFATDKTINEAVVVRDYYKNQFPNSEFYILSVDNINLGSVEYK